ncbi:MAG: hypothetical protein ACLUE1_06095, partial [Adlercreutzia equolifaciens]
CGRVLWKGWQSPNVGGASREESPMGIILEALNVLAMVSTIAAFILEVWKTWREDKREDAAGKENRG